MKPIAPMTVGLLMVLALACSDDGGDTKTTTALTREEVAEHVDDICKRTEATFVAADEKYLGDYRAPDVTEDPEKLVKFKEARSRMTTEAYIPGVERALDDMDGLEPEASARSELEALVEAGRQGLDSFRQRFAADPNFSDADEHPDPWEGFNGRAEALGVDSCAF